MIDRHEPELRGDYEAPIEPIFQKTCVTLDDEAARYANDGSNRNKPCPCRSGLKCKRCHGA